MKDEYLTYFTVVALIKNQNTETSSTPLLWSNLIGRRRRKSGICLKEFDAD